MTLQQILFLIFGAVTLGAALMVVIIRNLFHAALFMILSFFGVAGLYILLEAPYLAAAQLFVYIGGISILIIFAIMLTHDIMDPNQRGRNRLWIETALSAVTLCILLIWTIQNHDWITTSPGPVPDDSIMILAKTLVDPQGLALPFEVASVLLLTALIGAITIARRQ